MRWLSLLLLLVWFPIALQSQEQGSASEWISLHGHISKERVDQASERLEELSKQPLPLLVLSIDSSSGDLQSALRLANEIYRLRVETDTRVIVYIGENAVGPSALFPFLADELYGALVLSWGDVSLGSQGSVPTNLLRSKVRALVPNDSPHRETLLLLADGMSDPMVRIERDDGKVQRASQEDDKEEQALVLDQNELVELGIIKALLTPKQFAARFPIPQGKSEKVVVDNAIGPNTEEEAQKELGHHISFAEEGERIVGQIELDRNGIDRSTWIYVKSALEEIRERNPAFVIVKLDTPGGEIFAAQQISDALIDLDQNYDIPCVAFVDNWAISAGAMIAYSCRYIAAVKDSAMGAAEPIMMQAGGTPEEASEKVKSALRAEFANRAAYFDRNPDIAEAMVDKDVVVVIRHGKVIKLDNDEQIRTEGPDPDIVLSHKGKLLTLNSQQMVELGVADFLVEPAKVAPITAAELEAGEWPADKSLLFSYPFFHQVSDVVIVAPQKDWKTRFFSILTNPFVASLLFLGMMLGFYVEMNTPGFGVAGTIGLICLFFILLSSFSVQAVNWLEVILLATGVVLIALEIFVIPGFGVTGILGIVLFLAGLFALMLPGIRDVDFSWDFGDWNAAGEVVLERVAWLSGTLVVGIVCMYLLGRYVLPKVGRFSRLIHTGEEDRSSGYVAGVDVATQPAVGSIGVARTVLRPAGKVIIEKETYDAVSYGGYIAAGTSIVVIEYEGGHMVVGEVE